MRPTSAAFGLLLSVLLALGAGCTFEPGHHFAEITPRLGAAYVRRDNRETPDGRGWQKLASGYELRVGRASLKVAAVHLVGTGGPPASARASFDPANPPPGYSNCHNGHCHADDGRLVSYEEIAAGLAGGGASSGPVLSFGGAELDLLADPDLHPLSCAGPCALGRTEVTRLRVDLAALALEGEVRAGTGAQLPGGAQLFQLALAGAEGKPLLSPAVSLDLPTDNRHPPLVTLEIAFTVGPELFDQVDWSSLPSVSGELQLSGESSPELAARSALTEGLARASLGGRVQRSSP